jgi:cytochrome P450/NADPH-cytochrome P450 reductase
MIDELLEKAGAHRMAQMGKANAAVSDMFSDLESWEDRDLWSDASATGSGTVAGTAAAKFEQQIRITNPRAKALHKNSVECIISETRKLSEPGLASKHHVEIQLPAGMTYAPGDHISILPINPRQNIRRALARFHLAADSVLSVLRISHGGTLGQENLSAFDVFGSYVELAQPATRRVSNHIYTIAHLD